MTKLVVTSARGMSRVVIDAQRNEWSLLLERSIQGQDWPQLRQIERLEIGALTGCDLQSLLGLSKELTTLLATEQSVLERSWRLGPSLSCSLERSRDVVLSSQQYAFTLRLDGLSTIEFRLSIREGAVQIERVHVPIPS